MKLILGLFVWAILIANELFAIFGAVQLAKLLGWLK